MIMAFWFILDFHRCLALQNTAILLRLVGLAALAQSGELLLELRQFVDALIHTGDCVGQTRC